MHVLEPTVVGSGGGLLALLLSGLHAGVLASGAGMAMFLCVNNGLVFFGRVPFLCFCWSFVLFLVPAVVLVSVVIGAVILLEMDI